MANPLESRKIPFSPVGPIERRPVDPGRLEADDFIINDVPLRIAPTHIHVEKKAFNRQWQTLRTNSSQKLKSGHSMARVSFAVEFLMSDSDDLLTLTSLVAGLRATPFCVVHNLHLDRTLGRPDDTGASTDENKRYKNFKPIMLALASMTFETCGHERAPDKIRGTFDFVWFNYLPYTNMIAFKSGEDSTRPGHPWESEIWKRFYAPYELKSEPVQWPHAREDLYARTTEFLWREFIALPKGDAMSTEAANDVMQALRNKPKAVLNTINSVVSSTISSDAPNPEQMNEGVYDAVYRRLVREGHVNPSQEMQNWLDRAPNGSITAASSGVLSPLVRKLNKKSGISKQDLEEIDFAAGLMTGRLKKMREASAGQAGGFQAIENQDFVKLLDTNAKYDLNKKETFAAGLELFGRKRRYKIAHVPNPISPPDMITTRISVTFQNILATIPMVGYRYPTVQHVGSIDAHVNMIIDANNAALGDLNQMYGSIETNVLRYKQIPQGLNNLWINNDFLRLFGLSEFITESITMDTTHGSPGRSMVSFACVEAGVTSQTKLQDAVDSQERLTQENVQSSGSLRQGVWNELWKKTMMLQGSAPSHDVTYWNAFKDQVGWYFGRQGSLDLTSDTGWAYYSRRVVSIPADNRHKTYRTVVQSVVTAYNELLKQIHNELFDGGVAWAPGVTRDVNASILMTLKENDPELGFIPGIEAIKQSVRLRNKAYYAAGKPEKTVGIRVTEEKQIRQLGKARQRAGVLLNNEDVNADKQRKQLLNRQQVIADLGIPTYQAKVRRLLDEVTSKYLALPELQKFRVQIEKEGLQKGLMAYPDFRPQLASVAGGLEEGSVISDAELMKYDPDCYFWYPTYDGAQASPLNGFVDEHYILEAKRHSRSLAQDAQGQVGAFFQNTYMSLLQNDKNPHPHDVLTKDNNAGQLADALFVGDNIANATVNTIDAIHKSVVVDAGRKASTNWYPFPDPEIRSKHLCSHSVDIDSLWNGVDVSANAQNYTASQRGPSPRMVLPNERRADGQSVMRRDYSRDLNTPNFAWPIATSPSYMPAGYRFGAERSYRNGTHNGIDVPEPTRAQKPYGVNDGIYGTQVLAVAPGKVRWVRGPERVGGLRIGIDHGNGWHADYMHLKEGSVVVKAGDRVSQGQPLAQIGRTGVKSRSCATHLHFQVRYRGEFIDPLKVMPQQDVLALNAARRGRPGRDSNLNRIAQTQVQNSPTDTGVSPLRASIDEFEKSLLNGQGQSMMRAYPTFKLYFIEDDSGERKRLAYDDFFSYNSVQSIRVVRSRKIAADLCELYLTNISGVLSNRKFRQEAKSNLPRTSNGEIAEESTKAMRVNTAKENPIASLLLQEGIQIHLRLGYSSDPDRLDTVFNGVITEVQFSESDDLVRIVAQSYAIELIQDIKGLEKPNTRTAAGLFGWDFWGFGNNAATGRILEEMLAEPEVVHFGRWDANTDERNAARTLLTQRWTFQPQPADDNIFAPNPSDEFDTLANKGGLYDAAVAFIGKSGDRINPIDAANAFRDKWQYVIYRTTIWDICKEMTRRHPNFIVSAVPYKDKGSERMTLFYGLPNQLYFARHPSASEEFADERMQQLAADNLGKVLESAARNQLKRKDELQHALFGTGWTVEQFLKGGLTSPDLGKAAIGAAIRRAGIKINDKNIPAIVALAKENPSIISAANKFLRHKRLDLARAAGYIKPFRNYHLITSAQHIIANNIQANSRNVANNIVVKYGGEVGVEDADGKVAIKGDEQQFSLKLDSAIPDEDLRTQMGQFVNVTNAALAKRYALSMLCDNIKEIYKGEVCTIGNGKVKPYDVVYMVDEYTDMIGAFEVEEVQHIFDQQHGFRTEIKPDMLVQASEWSLLGSSEAMGVVMEGALHKLMGSDGPPTSTGGKVLSFMANMMGRGVAMVGGFMSQKILNYTQLAQPVVISPLLHHGRVFAGGVPTRKMPHSLWNTIMGEWNNNVDTGFDMAMEDAYDAVGNWIKKVTFQNTVGDFWNNGGS